MRHLRTSLRRALAVAAGALAVGSAPADAAVNVAIAGGDALEDRPITFIATGTTDSSNKIYATLRISGGAPCAPSFAADSGDGLFFGVPSGSQQVETIDEPGAYVVCSYLTTSQSAAPAEVFPLPFTVRANGARLTIQVAARGEPGVPIPVTLAGTTEIGRRLYARAKPVGSGPCAQSLAADPSSGSFADNEPALGAFAIPRLAGPFDDTGRYTLCAWLQEDSGDIVAEAMASATIDIVPPVPVLSSLDVSPFAFAALRAGGFAAGGLFDPTISYRLENTAASVRFAVAALRSGRRVGTSCRKLTRANRRRPHCSRYQTVPGSYTHAGTEGGNSLHFSGRVGGRRLRVGAYRLSATPRTATGAGRTVRRAFRIVRSG